MYLTDEQRGELRVLTQGNTGRALVAARSRMVLRNADCKPFTWTARANAILLKFRWVESEVIKLTGH